MAATSPTTAPMTLRGRRLLVVVGLLAVAAAAMSIPARATAGARVTADEPYYLLTAESLAEDGSLDIADELAARTYLPYHEVLIDQQTRDGSRRLSPHDPLLPVILALPMAVGGWVAAKATLSLVAGLVAVLTAWIAVRRFGVGETAATIVVAAASVGVPLAPYGAQVYPELPAALAVLVGFAAVTAPRATGRAAVVAGAAVLALPWLSVKYVPVAVVLALALLVVRHRAGRSLLPIIGALAVAGVAYLVAHRLWYGGWTVYAAGDHFVDTGELSVVGVDVDPVGRSRRVTGLLVDRDFGLLAWSPFWLLVSPALGAFVRRRPPAWSLVVTLMAVGWGNATFVALTMHGWWFPGRQVVVVVPLLVLVVAVFVDRHGWGLVAAGLTGLVGAFTWAQLALEASTGRRTLVVDFTDTAAPWHRLAALVLPDGRSGGVGADLVLVAWSVVVVAAGWWGWRSAAGSLPTPATRSGRDALHPAEREDRQHGDRRSQREEARPHL